MQPWCDSPGVFVILLEMHIMCNCIDVYYWTVCYVNAILWRYVVLISDAKILSYAGSKSLVKHDFHAVLHCLLASPF